MTAAPNVALPTLTATPVPADLYNQQNYSTQNQAVNASLLLDQGSINTCIAKHLRSQSPGTIGGEALLYTADEQRQLQQVIVERTRIAMLAYAGLGMVFVSPTPSQGSSPILGLMKTWGGDSANSSALGEMAEDFAYAVDLNVQASHEMLTLLGRSASAHLPRGGSPADPQDEAWGFESWRQRALALMYGGNPLSQNVDRSAPWTSTLSSADVCPGCPGINGGLFPLFGEPYVDVSIDDPHVQEFDRLVRAYDAMHIKQKSVPFGSNTFYFGMAPAAPCGST